MERISESEAGDFIESLSQKFLATESNCKNDKESIDELSKTRIISQSIEQTQQESKMEHDLNKSRSLTLSHESEDSDDGHSPGLYKVIITRKAKSSKELSLTYGQFVQVTAIFKDGWCFGYDFSQTRIYYFAHVFLLLERNWKQPKVEFALFDAWTKRRNRLHLLLDPNLLLLKVPLVRDPLRLPIKV